VKVPEKGSNDTRKAFRHNYKSYEILIYLVYESGPKFRDDLKVDQSSGPKYNNDLLVDQSSRDRKLRVYDVISGGTQYLNIAHHRHAVRKCWRLCHLATRCLLIRFSIKSMTGPPPNQRMAMWKTFGDRNRVGCGDENCKCQQVFDVFQALARSRADAGACPPPGRRRTASTFRLSNKHVPQWGPGAKPR
jgi:hypothetical protein